LKILFLLTNKTRVNT